MPSCAGSQFAVHLALLIAGVVSTTRWVQGREDGGNECAVKEHKMIVSYRPAMN